MQCLFCLKECKNNNSLSQHQKYCIENPNRIIKENYFPKIPWNKGLSKENDVRVLKHSKTVSKTFKENNIKPGCFSSSYWNASKRLEQSERKKKLYQDFPEAHPNRKLAGNRKKMTYPERIAYDWLIKNKIDFETQVRINSYYVDFLINKTVVEIDGEYWHQLNNEKDKIRDSEISSLGYKIYRIRAKEHIENRLEIIRVKENW